MTAPPMKLRFLLPTLIFAVLLAGCGSSATPPKVSSGDIAEVGSQHVTLAQYNDAISEERANLKASGTAFPKAGTSAYQQLQTTIVDALVQQAEFALEAAKLSITVTPAQLQAQMTALKKQYFKGSQAAYAAALKKEGYTDAEVQANVGERLLEQKLFNEVTKATTVTPAQVAAYYAQNLSQYSKPASRKVREILAGKNKQSLAEQIYSQLKAGGSWTTLAKKYSQDPGSKNSGGLFTAQKGSDVPQFDSAVFAPSATTGVVLKPVNTTQYGWFVIEPIAPTVAATVTSESKAAAAIHKTLLASQKQTVLGNWVQSITKVFCSGNQITYQVGYTPSPDPCASVTASNPTTT